jgi:hypothetical protein
MKALKNTFGFGWGRKFIVLLFDKLLNLNFKYQKRLPSELIIV